MTTYVAGRPVCQGAGIRNAAASTGLRRYGVTAVCGASHTERVGVHQRDSVLVGGFVGTVRYAAEGAADPQAVDALARLAPFSGVGAYTTRGFGGVRKLGE
ncbi:MAG: CRISPR system precrRNA processing endoribonuclease RAMP protein Cas6 [Pseudonocardiaceae bacterium]